MWRGNDKQGTPVCRRFARGVVALLALCATLAGAAVAGAAETPAREVLARHRNRTVLVFFFGPGDVEWLAGLDAMTRDVDGLVVVAVARYLDRTAARGYLRDAGVSWPLYASDGVARDGSWEKVTGSRSTPEIVLLSGGSDGKVIERAYPGAAVERALAGLFPNRKPPRRAAERGRVFGRLWHGDKPFVPARSRPNFWFRDEWRGTTAALDLMYDGATGEFSFTGPPGTYLVEATSGYPRADIEGAYVGTATFALPSATPLRLPLHRLIRMRSPIDNGSLLPAHGTYLVHTSPVFFAWKPLPGATAYRYSVRTIDQGAPFTVEGTTEDTEVAIPLTDGRLYEFDIDALAKDRSVVGRLEVYGQNFRGWDYRFNVGRPATHQLTAEQDLPAEKVPAEIEPIPPSGLPAERDPLPAEREEPRRLQR